MSFETLILRPVGRSVDLLVVRAWLNEATFVYPVGIDTWVICATPRLAILAEQDRGTEPLPLGVTVWADSERVGMTAYADAGAMARARDFLCSLSQTGQWMATVDHAPPMVLRDVDDIFGKALPATDTLLDDLTACPVIAGRLIRWGGDGYQLHVHSSGQLRFEAPKRTLRAELDEPTLGQWTAAVDAADVDDPALPENPPADSAVTLEIETPTSTAFAMLDGAAPPPSMKALCSLAQRWVSALAAWDGKQAIDGLTALREET